MAPWCAHSRSLAPAYDRVADHFAVAFPGRFPPVRVARVDAAAEPALWHVIFDDGDEEDMELHEVSEL